MDLSLLTPADVGAPARAKINAAITEARKIAGKADQADLAGIAAQLATEAAAREASYADLDATVRAQRYEFIARSGRPGDGPARYTLVSSVAQFSGDGTAFPAIPAGNIAFGDDGRVVRLVGSGIVAARSAIPLQKGRVSLLRWVVRRRANPSNPSNDSVQLLVVWLDQAHNVLAGQSTTVARSYDALITGSGRQEYAATMSASSSLGAVLVAPPGSRYALIAVQCFGTDGVTDIEVLQESEVFDPQLPSPISADTLARLGAQESLNTGPRLDVLEAANNNPFSVTYATKSDAQAAHVLGSATTIQTRGFVQAGDGGDGLYKRVESLPEGGAGFTSADGGVWQLVESFKAFLPTRANLGARIIPAVVTAFLLGGNAVGGDLGFRAPYVAGTSAGHMAIQDATGRWFQLDIRDEAHVGWFDAKGDGVTDDKAAVQAACNCGAKTVQAVGAAQWFNVHEITVPVGVNLLGLGFNGPVFRTSSLKPDNVSKWSFVLRLMGGNLVRGVGVSGNNRSDRGISIAGHFTTIEDLSVQYSYYGTFNEGFDLTDLVNVHYSELQYGHWNVDRGISVNFERCKFYNVVYGQFWSYTDQQPQTVRVYACQFEACSYGAWFDKDIYDVVIQATSFDNMSHRSLTFMNPTGQGLSDIRICDNFLDGGELSVLIDAGASNVKISGNGFGNGKSGLLILQATPTVRSENVIIENNSFGQAGNQCIVADSVNGCTIRDNLFTYSFEAPYNASHDIVTPRTYTAGPNPPVIVESNTFHKGEPIPKDGGNVKCRANRGLKTDIAYLLTIPQGFQQSPPRAHGLSIAPVAHLSGCNSGAINVGVAFDPVTATAYANAPVSADTKVFVRLITPWSFDYE